MLVFVMVASLLLYQQTVIILTADGFSNKSVHLAALQLLKNDPYANASRLERMSLFARNLLGGERTYKDYDSAVQIAIAQARYDEALAFNEKALASYDGDEEGAAVLYLRMGYLYAIQEQYEKAQEWLDLGIAVLPLAEAVLTRAQVRLNLNDADGALADVNACLDAVGDSVELLPNLINVVEASGQYERAANLWSRLIDAEGGADYLLHRAHCYFQLGRMADAEADAALYEQAGGTELGQANAMLGMGFMRAGEYDRAGDCFIRAMRKGYSDPESLYYFVVLCAYLTGDYQRVSEYGEQLITRAQRGEEIGTADIGVENTTGMLTVTLRPMDFGALCRMTGAAHMGLGNYSRAAEVLTNTLEQNLSDAYAVYLRGCCLLAAGEYQRAAEDFDTCIAAGEQTENSRYSRGVCRVQLGNTQGAVEDFDWVLQHTQDAAMAENAAGMIAEMTAQTEEVIGQE